MDPVHSVRQPDGADVQPVNLPEAASTPNQPGDSKSPLSRARAWWKRPKSKTQELVETVAVALVLAFFVRGTVAEARYIPSGSMEPTLLINDHVLTEKLSYHFEIPQRGDIVVFTPPARVEAGDEVFIKRVIGLPGDHMDIRDGHVYVNGKALVEPYIKDAPAYPDPDWAALGMPGGVVPKGDLFVMGDNRNDSDDSHIWGPLPIRSVIERAFLRYWPLDRLGFLGK